MTCKEDDNHYMDRLMILMENWENTAWIRRHLAVSCILEDNGHYPQN